MNELFIPFLQNEKEIGANLRGKRSQFLDRIGVAHKDKMCYNPNSINPYPEEEPILKKAVSLLICFVLTLAIIPAGTFSAEGVKMRPSYLFAIDAGHGGGDSGAINGDRYECNATAKVADEVIRLLQEQGQRTVLLDRNLPAKDRPSQANALNADFLISLHRDSAGASARGITVYTHDPSHLQRQMEPNRDYAPAEYANKHEVDERLVNYLQNTLSSATSMPFRGIRYGSANDPTYQDYHINRLSNMPSCLIELGYVTNADDNWVFDTQYPALALAIVKALLWTVDLNYVGPFPVGGVTVHEFEGEKYCVVNGVVAWNYTGSVVVDGLTYFVENGFVTNLLSGQTGSCNWLLDSTSLSVSGNGAMANYSSAAPPPWSTVPTVADVASGVTAIGDYAFYNAASLTEVSIAKTVVKIGASAFAGCSSLSRILYYGTKAEWEQITFGNENSVPDTVQILYICDIVGHQFDFVCDTTCDLCGETREAKPHTYSAVCDISCDVCGEIRETVHTYSGECDKVCDICSFIRKTEVPHTFDSNNICSVCGSKPYITGDVDGNEQITDWDSVLLARYLAGWEVAVSTPEALDIDNNKEITDWDSVLLDRYLAGWDITIG